MLSSSSRFWVESWLVLEEERSRRSSSSSWASSPSETGAIPTSLSRKLAVWLSTQMAG